MSGSLNLSTTEGYRFSLSYSLNVGIPYTQNQTDLPATATILVPVHGTATLRNTTPGHDADGQSPTVAVVGVFKATRPICATGANNSTEASGFITVGTDGIGRACELLLAEAAPSANALGSGASTTATFDAYATVGDDEHGYPSTATPIQLKAATLQSVLNDLSHGPTAWFLGIETAHTYGLKSPCGFTVTEGFLAGPGFEFVQFAIPPSLIAQSDLQCSDVKTTNTTNTASGTTSTTNQGITTTTST